MSHTIYRSERAHVVCGDARDVLGELATESADLLIVDPPYGVEWKSNRRAATFDALAGDGAGDRDGIRELLGEAVRVVGQHRHLYVFGPADVLTGQKVGAPVELVWDKGANGAGALNQPWAPAHEPITFAVSQHRHGGKAGTDSVPARLRKGSVLRFTRPTGRNVNRHPTEKPWVLLAELVESSSRADELIVDPCAGSGSTGVAAILRGRRVLLIDVDEGHARAAAARVQAAEALVDQAAKL